MNYENKGATLLYVCMNACRYLCTLTASSFFKSRERYSFKHLML